MHSSRMCTVRCSGRWGGMYPSMHWAGGCLLGVSAQGGVCPGGVCPGDSAGMTAQRGVCQTPPPVNRMTDTCENITLPQLRFGR